MWKNRSKYPNIVQSINISKLTKTDPRLNKFVVWNWKKTDPRQNKLGQFRNPNDSF